jgi:hypothetical protein
MTLILLIANDDQVVQVSDRRFTGDRQFCTDEGAKIGTVVFGDARLAFAFTGLAMASNYVTLDWLMQKIRECAPPDYSFEWSTFRLSKLLDIEFASNANLRGLHPAMKRLSIVFAGYVYSESGPPLLTAAEISNFGDLVPSAGGAKSTQIDAPSSDAFLLRYRRPADPTKPSMFTARIGAWQATTDGDVAALTAMAATHKPARAIVGKAVKIIRTAADHKSSRGVIGKQLNSIVVPPSLERSVEVDYHSVVNTNRFYWPAQVDARLGMRACLDLWVEQQEPPGPWIVPQVRRDYPCPCKSGKRYRNCHGKLNKNGSPMTIRHVPLDETR